MSWGLVGHERVLAMLRQGLEQDQLPQSLLLTGPSQVGKRSTALALARAINCSAEQPEQRPCGGCRSCRLGEQGGFPDLQVVELRDSRQKIGIADIQALQTQLARRPSEGRRRVVVIADAERLSSEAENCLLKTLEEPPPYAMLILTVQDAEALLPTTVSRCRQLRLRPVASTEIASYLSTELGADSEKARLLAGLAEGRPGWAIAAARDEGIFGEQRAALKRLERALSGGKLDRLEVSRAIAERWSSKSDSVREELRLWARWWRSHLLQRAGMPQRLPSIPSASGESETLAGFSTEELRAGMSLVLQALSDLDQNANPRLALDVALLRLPRVGEHATRSAGA